MESKYTIICLEELFVAKYQELIKLETYRYKEECKNLGHNTNVSFPFISAYICTL